MNVKGSMTSARFTTKQNESNKKCRIHSLFELMTEKAIVIYITF